VITQLFARQPEFEILDMTADDTAEAAAVHSARFRRAWSDEEIHSLLAQTTVFGFVARRTSTSAPIGGFVLARAAAGEAEILTIGVHARHERKALGWRLMRAAIREAESRDAEAMFLEVDETNVPALTLYRTLGFRRIGERKAYYGEARGQKSSALVMRLDLGR
jgi:ribosomal-protein-alanine N-acetyltransferase